MKKLFQTCFYSLSFFCFCLNRILKSFISVRPLQKLDKFQIIWKQKWFLLLIEKALHHYDNDNPSEKTLLHVHKIPLKSFTKNCPIKLFLFQRWFIIQFWRFIHNQIAKLITDSRYLLKSGNYLIDFSTYAIVTFSFLFCLVY